MSPPPLPMPPPLLVGRSIYSMVMVFMAPTPLTSTQLAEELPEHRGPATNGVWNVERERGRENILGDVLCGVVDGAAGGRGVVEIKPEKVHRSEKPRVENTLPEPKYPKYTPWARSETVSPQG
ncbi:hypothetical protein K440DRAFT_638625 [Wilcoxina mikolae CBS 423.85]|nr:hypothetical protein K440DRAFT_638625 [Wilcoxina mikolae CBS 423.85]